jgi:DNA modification methylase
MSDEDFSEFLLNIMHRAIQFTVPGSIHYIFMDWRHSWHMTSAAMKAYGSPVPKQMCVWHKDIMANGSFYRAQQELCFVFQNGTAKSLWHNDLVDNGGFYKNDDELCFIFKNGDGSPHLSHLELKDRIRTNVWKYPSANSLKNPDRNELKNHPTPKPVAMIADAILDTTNPQDIVVDFFLGSGTTIIAADKTDRRGFGCDLEPQYIQSIIKRYVLYCEKNHKAIDFKHLNGTLTLNDFTNEK